MRKRKEIRNLKGKIDIIEATNRRLEKEYNKLAGKYKERFETESKKVKKSVKKRPTCKDREHSFELVKGPMRKHKDEIIGSVVRGGFAYKEELGQIEYCVLFCKKCGLVKEIEIEQI